MGGQRRAGPRAASARVAAAVGAAAFLAACSAHPAPAADDNSAIVVGIQTEPLNGALGALHVVTAVDGAARSDETLAPGSLPHEVRLVAPSGSHEARATVRVEGFQSASWTPQSPDAPLLVRTAEASFVPGQTRLLRVLLENHCLEGLPGGPPGAPSCPAPQTCIGGLCGDDSTGLELYASGWAANLPDICKPANAPPPVLQVGTGQSDYLPLTAGQTLQAELGPQGGHHVWIAVRQQNLKQSGLTTTITSLQPTTGLAGPRTAFVFTFSPDEGNFCKLSGLRYQLDADGVDYHQFLGQPLDVQVTIADAAGVTGTGLAHITIAPTILCPTGMSGC